MAVRKFCADKDSTGITVDGTPGLQGLAGRAAAQACQACSVGRRGRTGPGAIVLRDKRVSPLNPVERGVEGSRRIRPNKRTTQFLAQEPPSSLPTPEATSYKEVRRYVHGPRISRTKGMVKRGSNGCKWHARPR